MKILLILMAMMPVSTYAMQSLSQLSSARNLTDTMGQTSVHNSNHELIIEVVEDIMKIAEVAMKELLADRHTESKHNKRLPYVKKQVEALKDAPEQDLNTIKKLYNQRKNDSVQSSQDSAEKSDIPDLILTLVSKGFDEYDKIKEERRLAQK